MGPPIYKPIGQKYERPGLEADSTQAMAIGRHDWARKATSNMTHTHRCQAGAGCWQEDFAPRRLNLSRGLLST